MRQGGRSASRVPPRRAGKRPRGRGRMRKSPRRGAALAAPSRPQESCAIRYTRVAGPIPVVGERRGASRCPRPVSLYAAPMCPGRARPGDRVRRSGPARRPAPGARRAGRQGRGNRADEAERVRLNAVIAQKDALLAELGIRRAVLERSDACHNNAHSPSSTRSGGAEAQGRGAERPQWMKRL